MQEVWYGEQKVAREMTKEQLELKFELGLSYINLSNSNICGNGFKLKHFTIRKDPQWPTQMNLFAEKSLEVLNFTNCSINKNDTELFATCLYNQLENYNLPQTKIRVLNLSRNNLTKEGAKILAPALEGNKSLEVLDLS